MRSRTAVAPLERLKILLQVQNPHAIKYNGTIQGLKYIYRTEGFRGAVAEVVVVTRGVAGLVTTDSQQPKTEGVSTQLGCRMAEKTKTYDDTL
ncbi:mitochondrial adenine nucleotide transporter ADNT1 [Artemisia annua]|uniref:Mitochondrial adenine nucleotide transporter ADNT1 n=1 Tax=Artemisia annua TaxID=35608 RepID=A0A2U1MRR5_ARTAN|nr:mitochondrial adenine nucleotide transporter ADNT1 [Artemisia annua]